MNILNMHHIITRFQMQTGWITLIRYQIYMHSTRHLKSVQFFHSTIKYFDNKQLIILRALASEKIVYDLYLDSIPSLFCPRKLKTTNWQYIHYDDGGHFLGILPSTLYTHCILFLLYFHSQSTFQSGNDYTLLPVLL